MGRQQKIKSERKKSRLESPSNKSQNSGSSSFSWMHRPRNFILAGLAASALFTGYKFSYNEKYTLNQYNKSEYTQHKNYEDIESLEELVINNDFVNFYRGIEYPITLDKFARENFIDLHKKILGKEPEPDEISKTKVQNKKKSFPPPK